jgi:hypothetical protein
MIWDRRSSLRIRKCTCHMHPDDEVKWGKGAVQDKDPEWWKQSQANIEEICSKEWNTLYLQQWQRKQAIQEKPKQYLSDINQRATKRVKALPQQTNSLLNYAFERKQTSK